MKKPHSLSAFIRNVSIADPLASILYSPTTDRPCVDVLFSSALAKDDIVSEYQISVLSTRTENGPNGWPFFRVKFDASGLSEKSSLPSDGFSFDKISQAKKVRRSVARQEEDGAALIGGQRHVGSGALGDLKSDASSSKWQQEAKQTKAASMSVSLKWLDKITREARVHGKRPMLHLRFTDIPDLVVADPDWVVVQASVFEQMRRLEDGE
jgi:hypothetical protein